MVKRTAPGGPSTPEHVAQRWGVSANTVRNMIRRGELRAFRVGRLYRVPADAVAEVEQRAASEPDEGP